MVSEKVARRTRAETSFRRSGLAALKRKRASSRRSGKIMFSAERVAICERHYKDGLMIAGLKRDNSVMRSKVRMELAYAQMADRLQMQARIAEDIHRLTAKVQLDKAEEPARYQRVMDMP